MKLTKCSQGHFYDADKFDACPHCSSGQQASQSKTQSVPIDDSGSKLTEKVSNAASSQSQTRDVNKSGNETLKSAVDDVQKTVGIFNKKTGKEPVVGWLVCIEGEHYGEDFRIKMGRNFIGRGNEMDIVLSKDGAVSRSKHSIIVYEPKGNVFIVQAGESKELAYLNDSVILSPQQMKAYDVISLGASKLMFVPFCSDKFVWPENEK